MDAWFSAGSQYIFHGLFLNEALDGFTDGIRFIGGDALSDQTINSLEKIIGERNGNDGHGEEGSIPIISYDIIIYKLPFVP